MFYVNLQFYSGIILINLCLFGYLMINVNIIIIIHVNCIGIGNKFMTSGSRQIKIKQYVCNKNISKHLFFFLCNTSGGYIYYRILPAVWQLISSIQRVEPKILAQSFVRGFCVGLTVR